MNNSGGSTDRLNATLSDGITALADSIESRGRGGELLAIAFIMPDSVNAIVAALLFDGDLPGDAPAYKRLSPVEWTEFRETPFESLNQYLEQLRPSPESDADYENRVTRIVEASAEEIERARLPDRFPRLSFFSFAGVDPNPVLEKAEREFVRRMNPPAIVEAWEREFS